MWFSDGQVLPGKAKGSTAAVSSSVKLLRGMLEMPVRVLFLTLTTPELPIFEISGRLERVESDQIILELNGRLPQWDEPIEFGVEITGQASLLRFRARAAEEPVPGESALILSLPEQIEQVQRRHFARVPYSGKVMYEQVTGGKRFGSGRAVALDLSAGGLKMLTAEALGQGQELLLSFETPEGRSFSAVRSTVVRVQRQGGKWAIACRFDSLSRIQEEALVQAVFRIQLRNPVRD